MASGLLPKVRLNVERKLLFICAVLVSLVSVNCASSANQAQDITRLELTELSDFSENSRKYEGQRVRLRGYLHGSRGSLWSLYNSKKPGPGADFVFVKRSAKKVLSDGTIIDPADKCTNYYVEIVGTIGVLPYDGPLGIDVIDRITVFRGEAYAAPGELCYEAQT